MAELVDALDLGSSDESRESSSLSARTNYITMLPFGGRNSFIIRLARMSLFRRRAALFLGIVAVMVGQHSVASPRQSKLLREASAVLGLLLPDTRPQDDMTCRIGSAWLDQPVPEAIGREYLRSSTHAVLSGPSWMASVSDVVALNGVRQRAFCDNGEFDAYQKERVAAFSSVVGSTPHFSQRRFAFPVFNDDYTRAIVVFANVGQSYFLRDGQLRPADLGVFIGAAIFKKENRGWKQLKLIPLDES